MVKVGPTKPHLETRSHGMSRVQRKRTGSWGALPVSFVFYISAWFEQLAPLPFHKNMMVSLMYRSCLRDGSLRPEIPTQ